ncbi:MAG: biosynthetic-type acetolactate synthase large subunit [Acetivibrionales bacterium]|jgi:acetolactate synthase-1/2/3 large subunit|nr:biosynthetic-type acetolactate synthase large subunit [Bacillota bacterium]NLP08430.1 biosynthetic-type acetolactate synthase large subunit [Clostridiaceae bacterium]HOA55789.1 biosynthetic-type acetolactate synthase large subunit [Clostridiales bacterium]HQD31735.1 biosynthetic-type acetolactate synthase large subunit [Clostridiales bacterium]
MRLTGAEILIECLKEQGVDTIFGFPGGAVLNIYDALYKAKDEIRHILTSHEQGASHAADGYARATGKTGVCIATSGPGATNLVTGIATAYMDSVPMVAITGQVATSLLGKDSFQEVDITGITMPITKHNYIVKDVNKLADTVRDAFRIASSGRPGPVLIDICKDVTAAFAEYEPREPVMGEAVPLSVKESDLEEAAAAINSAKRPVILSGGGVSISGANRELQALAEKAGIPVSTTLMGLGSFPGDHRLFMGLVGMHGTRTSNTAVSEADLFIAIGARFSDRVISNVSRFAPNARIMHIDIDPAEIGKNITVHYPLVGNIKEILRLLAEKVEARRDTDWNRKIDEWKEQYPLRYEENGTLKPHYIVERLYEITKGEAIITTEVGQNQLWAAQYYKYSKPRQFISSGGLGTMGYGLGACIGAQIGRPDAKVINIAGDGSFRMNCTEIATAVEYKLPVVIAILNNSVLGMVRQWQQLFYGGRYSATTIDRGTDFVALAEAFGAVGIRVTKPEEVDAAFERALASKDRPVLIDFVIDKDEKVFPIVPPGAPIDELIEE